MRTLPFLLLAAPLAAGCASQVGFPSLAERPIERALAGRPTPPCLAGADPAQLPPRTVPVAAPSDPALPARLEQLLAGARSGASAFTAARTATERAVAAAGAPGSDSWAAAQTSLSRLEAARTPTTRALSELDALLLARADSANADDLSAIGVAVSAAQALADEQTQTLSALAAQLRAP